MESYRDLIRLPVFQTNLQILRSWCFWAAIISLCQSLIFGILTLYEIFAYNCLFPFPFAPNNYKNVVKTILLELYYKGSCRANKPSKINLDNIIITLKSSNLLIVNSTYFAVTICWMISSIILLLSLKNKRFSLNGKVIIPWVVIASIIWIYDLVFGTIIYLDLSRLVKQLYRLSVTKNDELYKYTTTVIIMLFMLFKAFKGFILWIINILAVIYITIHYIRCTVLGTKNIERINLCNMGKNTKKNKKTRNNSVDGETKLPKPDGSYTNDGYILETNTIDNVSNMLQIMSNLDENALNRAVATCSVLPSYENSSTYRSTEAIEPQSGFQPNMKKSTNAVDEKLNPPMQQSSMQLVPARSTSTPSPDYTPPMSRAISSGNSKFNSNPTSLSSF